MLSRLLYGGRLSLLTGTMPVIIATVIGTAIGATAGYVRWRGRLGCSCARWTCSTAFPAIMLAIAIGASLGPGREELDARDQLVFIPPMARVAEAATRGVVFLEYIEAAGSAARAHRQIILSQMLPNIFNPIFVYASGLVGLSIVVASGLSFLGLGARRRRRNGATCSTACAAHLRAAVVAALPGLPHLRHIHGLQHAERRPPRRDSTSRAPVHDA